MWTQIWLKRIAFISVTIQILLSAPFSLHASDGIVFYREGLKNWCIGAAHGDPKKADALLAKIKARLGDKASYDSNDVAIILQIVQEISVPASSPSLRVAANPSATPLKLKPHPTGWDVVTYRVTHPLIRQSYTDVLSTEDPSQTESVNNISGALFSYTHDGKTNQDVWSTQAALILPFVWHYSDLVRPTPDAFGIVPSVSLDKITGNSVASKNVDSLIFRSGLYGLWLVAGESPHTESVPEDYNSPKISEPIHAQVSVLGSFTYGTDTNFDLSLPGGDLNIEPQIYFSKFVGLGYEVDRHADVTNPKDIDFAYQLRGWLHAEGGVLQHEGLNETTPEGDFFRVGPEAQLKLMFPKILAKGLTLQAEIHYLAPLTGTRGRNPYYFTTSAELGLWKDVENNRQIGLKASYEDGSLDYTKQNVDDFKFSISISF
jgi:hypothetical protein